MAIQVNNALQILERTPLTLQAMLSGLADSWVYQTEGGDTWSPFDIVGHLIHGEETDWLPRIRLILEHGESVPFTPFDRFAQFTASKGKSLGQLLQTFGMLRADSLEQVRALNLTEEQLNRPGKHPALGRVTLGQLIATWAVHDLDHVAQIARCMAGRYRDRCGPWSQYLPILGAKDQS